MLTEHVDIESALLERDGVVVLPALLDDGACDHILDVLARFDGAGSRNLLEEGEIRMLAGSLRDDPVLAALLPHDAVCVQCTLFSKDADARWAVGAHQDLGVPVAHRVDALGFTGWREKEGVLYVQPPAALLARLVAVRLQLDPDAAASGPLEVVPGSHHRRLSAAEAATFGAATRVPCVPDRGGAVVMRPLVVHASGKGDPAIPRRVLHFVYAPPSPGHGLAWATAI